MAMILNSWHICTKQSQPIISAFFFALRRVAGYIDELAFMLAAWANLRRSITTHRVSAVAAFPFSQKSSPPDYLYRPMDK